MKRFLLTLSLVFTIFGTFLISPTRAQEVTETPGAIDVDAFSIGLSITGWSGDPGDMGCDMPQNQIKFKAGGICGETTSGLIPMASKKVAQLYELQPSSEEYVADIMENIGFPQASQALAQSSDGGTGYSAMRSFLPFWKAFRNLAYSLYIIIFIVIGVMIMLRTKVNAQTIITIQSALPNLVITLILITFSYAIVGFMIDLMYFLMYFIAYLFSSIGVLDGAKTIERLTTHSAWGVIFSGRNSIVSVVAETIRQILGANSLPGYIARTIGAVTTLGVSELAVQGIPYLLVAVWLAMTMLKLIYVLAKSYVMLIVQTVTAPIQILFNALPGSKAFSEWLKKTASYLIPFPVAAAMFIVAAMFLGNPTNSTKLKSADPRDANPFGINESHEFYQGWEKADVWMPPFTIDFGWEAWDIMILLGFFILTMTPAAVQMAQDWLQVKESPYTSEIGATFGAAKLAYDYPAGIVKETKKMAEQRRLMQDQASWIGNAISKDRQATPVK